MSKNKDYLVLVGSLEEILHFGDFSQNWWETRQAINSNDVGSVSVLYPICINMKISVILNGTEFFITVVQGCESSPYQPGYTVYVNLMVKKVKFFSCYN